MKIIKVMTIGLFFGVIGNVYAAAENMANTLVETVRGSHILGVNLRPLKNSTDVLLTIHTDLGPKQFIVPHQQVKFVLKSLRNLQPQTNIKSYPTNIGNAQFYSQHNKAAEIVSTKALTVNQQANK